MFQNKTDILLFLLCIGILIFAEKIVIAGTCQTSTVKFLTSITCLISNIWHSKSNKVIGVISYFRKNKYLADWNATKMKYNGKKWISSMSTIFYQKLWPCTYLFSGNIGSKFIQHGKDLLRNLKNFYMLYVGESETDVIVIDRCIYKWDRLLECEKLIDSNNSDRNKLTIDIFLSEEIT
jgi:hypothetical protein